jgi:hypothetical protein
VNDDAEQLRCQARHCRDLAEAHYDRRTQLMLRSMAKQFDEHAAQLEVSCVISPVISAT